MKIQVNKHLVSGKYTKAELSAKTKQYNFIDNWITLDVDLLGFKEILLSGFAIRSGIKVGGNSKAHITEVNLLILDFDTPDFDPTKFVSGNEYFKNIVSIYPTPSYSEDTPYKYRVVMKYSEPVSAIDHEAIIKTFFKKDKFNICDKSGVDAGRFFHGANINYRDEIYFCEDAEPLDAKNLLGSIVPATPPGSLSTVNTGKISKHSGTKVNTKNKPNKSSTDLFLDYLYDELVKKNGTDWELYQVYSLYQHEFKPTGIDDDRITGKWCGFNPFSETNSSGTSFVVSKFEDISLPVWFDRSNNDGGNFVEYWKRIKNISFKKAVSDICSHFGVEQYQLPNKTKTDDKTQFVLEVLGISDINELIYDFLGYAKDKVRIVSNSWIENSENMYFYYNCSENKWELGNRTNLYTQIESDFIFNNYVGIDKFVEPMQYIQIKDVVKNVLMRHLLNSLSVAKLIIGKDLSLTQMPLPYSKYVAFSNGYLNSETKEFSKFLPEIYNQSAYDFPYDDSISSQNNFQFIKDYIKLSYSDSPIDAKIFETWCILNVLGVAYKTKNHLGLIGKAGSGKTTNMRILEKLTRNYGSVAQEADLEITNRFGLFPHISAKSIFINEYSGKGKSNLIKSMTGTGTTERIRVEPKGKTSFMASVQWSFTMVSEGKPFLSTSDEGQQRRYVFIETVKRSDNISEISKYLRKLQQEERDIDEFYQKCITEIHKNYNPDDVLDDWCKLVNSDEIKARTKAVAAENSYISSFVQSNLVISNSSQDYLTNDTMMQLIVSWRNTNKQDIRFSAPRDIGAFRTELERYYGWTLNNFSNNRVTIGKGKRKQAFFGVRLRTEDDDDFNFPDETRNNQNEITVHNESNGKAVTESSFTVGTLEELLAD